MSKKKNNWRLPTAEELVSLYKYNTSNTEHSLKDIRSAYYWSSNIGVLDASLVWAVFFSNGYSLYVHKSNHNYVRCIRTSKKGKLQWSKTSKKKMTWDEAIEYAKNLKAKVYYKEK